MTTKNHQLAQARGHHFVERIINVGGHCMEQVIDRKSAVYFERWLLPNGVSVVVMYGPIYGELFIESAPFQSSWTALEQALAAAAALKRS